VGCGSMEAAYPLLTGDTPVRLGTRLTIHRRQQAALSFRLLASQSAALTDMVLHTGDTPVAPNVSLPVPPAVTRRPEWSPACSHR
jgi:hypothetical protein